MKKIIFTLIIISAIGTPTMASCLLDNLESCTTTMDTGLNKTLKDKILPNNLEQQTLPNSSFHNRNNLGQPNMPSSINMEQEQQEKTQPYNANCQFGNCINQENSGQNSNPR